MQGRTELSHKTAAQTKNAPRPRVGVALGGGGVRGFAHIGVLKALVRAGIPVDLIAGTSVGGIVGAPFAAGHSVEEIEIELLRLVQLRSMVRLIDLRPNRRGLIQRESVHQYFAEQLGADLRFSHLPIPLALIAADIQNGKEIVLTQGSVIDAICATMAVPGVIAPMDIDGRKLVDGGILNNVPADVARSMGADVVIAVDVAAARLITDPETGLSAEEVIKSSVLPRFALDMWRAQAIMMQEIVRLKLESARPDILLKPPVPPEIGMFNGMGRAVELIAMGEETTEAALPAIQAALEGKGE